MRQINSLIFFLIGLLGHAQLNGTYTIDLGGGGDHISFSAAAADLTAQGVSGPVVFEVVTGTYTEQVSLLPVTGASSTNTITFRSQSLNNADVILRYPATNSNLTNHVVRMSGADHVTFEHITMERYGASASNSRSRVVEYPQLSGGEASQNCTFTNMLFIGDLAGFPYWSYAQIIYSANTNNELQTQIVDSRFEGGGNTVYWDQNAADDRLLVRGNSIEIEFNGLYFADFDHDLDVDSNSIGGVSSATNPIAISLSSCHGGFIVQRNHVRFADKIGILLSNCQASAASRGVVRNNMVIVTGSLANCSGIELFGTCRYIDVLNNSVSLNSGRGFDEGCSGGNDLRLVNNVIRMSDPGFAYAIYKNGGATYSQASNNCLYTVANSFARWNSIVADMSALQTASGMFASSIECDPLYFDNANDLHSYSMDLNAAGVNMANVADDFDGEVRSTNPDIGADEFIPELWTEAYAICAPTDPVVSTGSGKKLWIYKDRKVVASFNDNGNVLGTVNGDVYINSGPVRTSSIGQYYLDRNWRIDPQNAISGANVDIDLYFHQSEFGLLQAIDPAVNTITDVGISQYSGPNENCQIADNTTVGDWTVHFPTPDGTMPEVLLTPYRMSASLSDFSEFYITTWGYALPIELTSFTGRRMDREQVMLDWRTATETNNAGFEVWRGLEGQDGFEQVGWVEGAGNSQAPIDYQFQDHNPSAYTSYYFLRQVDHDGGGEESDVLAVSGSPDMQEPLLWPNPASSVLHVSGISIEQADHVISDAQGRAVKMGVLPAGPLDVQELGNGMYHLLLTANGRTWNSRFVIER